MVLIVFSFLLLRMRFLLSLRRNGTPGLRSSYQAYIIIDVSYLKTIIMKESRESIQKLFSVIAKLVTSAKKRHFGGEN